MLKSKLRKKILKIRQIANAKNIIITLGTEIDKYMNPKTKQFLESLNEIKEYLDSGQTIIIRSTIHPTVSKQMIKNFGWDKKIMNNIIWRKI